MTPHPKPHLSVVQTDQPEAAITVEGVSIWYGENCVISDLDFALPGRGLTCIVGPSGSGKSTFLRSLNRINDDVEGYRLHGRIRINGRDIQSDFPDITQLRSAVGMVFQKPCVFPRSIRENVLFGVRERKMSRTDRDHLVEESLKSAALWNEVSHRLSDSALTLSLGQQQRLCIARALAVKPDILLLDEPTASVDPMTGREIERLILSLKTTMPLIMVTHDIRQTRRVADTVVFMCEGRVIESGPCDVMFSDNAAERTQLYLSEDYCEC